MKRKEIIVVAAALIGVVANMVILWNITTWDILELIFTGMISLILEVWACILLKEFLQSYWSWKKAEEKRIEQSQAKHRRRQNYRDFNLREDEEDEWYEVPLEQVI